MSTINLTSIAGVIYKTKSGKSQKYPYYMATETSIGYYAIACYPVNKQGNIMPGYESPIPILAAELGEPTNLNLSSIANSN